MTRQSLLLAMSVLVVLNLNEGESTTAVNLNSRNFAILCDIYNIAAHPTESLYDPAWIREIEAKIDAINASLADDDWFKEVGKAKSEAELTPEFKSRNSQVSTYWERWKVAVEQVQAPTGQYSKLPSNSEAVRIARARLKGIETNVEEIGKKIREANNSAVLGTIRQTFDDAISGATSDQDSFGIGSTDRGAACGTTGTTKGTKAGTNLVVDFLCLCAAHTHASGCSGNNACGQECIGDTERMKHNWQGSGPASPQNVWEALKEGCKKRVTPAVPRAQDGRRALAVFESTVAVGLTGDGSKGIPGLFGHCDGSCSATDCDGTATGGNKGICVVYGKTQADWDKIDWLKKMKTGLGLLETAEKINITIQQGLADLRVLEHRAEEIYEETKVSIELEKNRFEKPTQNSSQKQNLANSADKATAQEPSVVNSADALRFILPWSLLI